MSRRWHKPKVTAPARQEKRDRIAAAVEKRGYKFLREWDSSLTSSVHGWKVNVGRGAGCIEDLYVHEVVCAEFDDLVALFEDDLLWAQFVHDKFGESIARDLKSAQDWARYVLKQRGDWQVSAWWQEAEGNEHMAERYRAMATAKGEEFATAFAKVAPFQRAMEEWTAGRPATVLAALAYLDSLEKRQEEL